MCVFHMGSSFARITNVTLSPVGRGEPKEALRSRLQVLRENDHCQQIMVLPL